MIRREQQPNKENIASRAKIHASRGFVVPAVNSHGANLLREQQTMAKYRRQPKAGELASRGSARFAIEPRDTPARACEPMRPASERENIAIPAHIKIKTYPARVAYGAETWRIKGGMTGGATGSTRGVCSCNGSGVVPQAFMR
jgi:hypothetical protein